MKRTVILFAAAVLSTAAIPLLQAQSSIDGYNVSVNAPIRVIAVQDDGKVLLGGDFTLISTGFDLTFQRDRIVRLNPDGSLDTAFNVGVNGSVRAIAVQRDGRVLIGGDFTIVNKRTSRNHIARLDGTTGAVDTSFDPNANDSVTAIAVQRNAGIVFGGSFTTVGGETRLRIARVDTTGALDSFNPRAGAQVNCIVIQPDARILVGGAFVSIGGLARNRIARLDASTAQSDSFNPNSNGPVNAIALEPNGDVLVGGDFRAIGGRIRDGIARVHGGIGDADSFDPTADNVVFSIAVQSDGGIVVGGAFANIGGQPRNRIARLNPFNGQADGFDPNANSIVLAVAAQQDGKVLLGGFFTNLTPNDSPFTITHPRIARLEIDGRIDQTLDLSNIGGPVLATAVQTDGKILIGGIFNQVQGLVRHNMARLNTDGSPDELFDPSPNGAVQCITVQPDGNILIGGTFNMLSPFSGPVARTGIVRIEPVNGTVDPNFNANSNGGVAAIALQRDGKIIVGGSGNGGYSNIGGLMRHNLARLDPTNGHADAFNPNPQGGEILCAIVLPDQRILVGGGFTSIGGQPRRKLARLNSDGSVDNQFHPDPTGSAPNGDGVFAIALQGDQKIIVGGGFNNIGATARTNIARIQPDTGLADNSFIGNADNLVRALVIQADGRVIAGGTFSNIGTFPRTRIGRLESSGLADIQFNPVATTVNNGPAAVFALGLQADGKILTGGQFDDIGQAVRYGFSRLTNNTAALQNLVLTQSSINWSRKGSSPQFHRATFEFSNDNVNFTFLGDGTATGSNWFLGGLDLPIGQNFVIRARGFYGCNSGSALGFRRSRALTAMPVIQSISSSPATIWPPNNELDPVTLSVDATDDTDPNPMCEITSISFVDPAGGDSDDDSARKMKPAYQITGNLTASLLAGPKGRVYTIAVQCTDNSNHSDTASVNIAVPRNQSGK